ncbi:MAG: UDP-N-acetylmuramate:L-alanyl-gamma-D-glutamyl-meso-diaminopimelate ligase [Pyrinomonadaceae bacterium]|nr:UDP-N-acetylmuramate:L-alanyl-gamma-D-glutamyl-meso-diaminopimelate ligase [Pyrinomonadaceae bacterium]MBP6214346.1 UDP-N-acetylmuramate:L-alanyl-gamma-D-glutamyl-meso-diaminopimelate ligase [Pyrinomonadaceae bacterium]
MHYHLIGICGTAMASLAGMLQSRGHRVTGSDQNVYPPMSTQLEALGIEIMSGYKAENTDLERDITVVGNTIMRGNPELEELLNRKLVYRSQAETVREEFIRGRHSLVVAGTHGKTTTTSIAAWVCEVGGLDPTFLVGGIVQNFGASFRVTEGEHFVIEGDEYDTAFFDKKPKFMSYLPEIAIVGNIEFDHADIYKDLDAIKWQFSRLMNLVPGNGRLICGIDSPAVVEVLASMEGKLYTTVETYGLSDAAKWQARDIEFTSEGTRFKVYKRAEASDQRTANDEQPWGEFTTKMIGEFNVRNCLAVIIAADAWGISHEKIQEAFDTFKSVKRRMEVRGIERGVTVIDDFAHHPTAVDETLKALRQRYVDNRLIAVFEPRSRSSRLSVFEEQYKRAFAHADHVIIAGVFNPEDAKRFGDTLLDVEKLVSDIAASGKEASTFPDADAIVEHLAPELRDGDVVAVMSNGGFGGIHEKLLLELRT